MLRAKSLTVNVVADVTGFPDLSINLAFLASLGGEGVVRLWPKTEIELACDPAA
jgi:hypothetical protein